MNRFLDSVLNVLMSVSCLVLVFITLSVCLEVVLRYFFNRPQVWVVELSEYSLLYITFLAAAWVLKKEGHITVDLMVERLPQRKRTFLSIINYILCTMVSAVLFWHGIRVTWDYFARKVYNPTILEFPTAAVLVIIPVGGLFLVIQSIRGVHTSLALYKRRKR